MLIRSILNIIFKFSIFFVIFVMVGYISLKLILNPKKNNKKSKHNVKIWGLFMGLNDRSILQLSIYSIRYIFIIYMMFNTYELVIIHLYVLLFLSIIYGIISKSIKTLIIELISCIALFFSLYSSKQLSGYLYEVRFVWYIFIANILLKGFIFIYSTYFYIKNLNEISASHETIRKVDNYEK